MQHVVGKVIHFGGEMWQRTGDVGCDVEDDEGRSKQMPPHRLPRFHQLSGQVRAVSKKTAAVSSSEARNHRMRFRATHGFMMRVRPQASAGR